MMHLLLAPTTAFTLAMLVEFVLHLPEQILHHEYSSEEVISPTVVSSDGYHQVGVRFPLCGRLQVTAAAASDAHLRASLLPNVPRVPSTAADELGDQVEVLPLEHLHVKVDVTPKSIRAATALLLLLHGWLGDGQPCAVASLQVWLVLHQVGAVNHHRFA